MGPDNTCVTAVDRALNILECIGASSKPLTVKELSQQLDIPTASCFRIVKNLLNRGYLMESHDLSGQYDLGFRLVNLSEQALHKLDIRSTSISFMREISTATCQAVQLGVLQPEGVVYIEQALPLQPVDVIASLHKPLPVNISAAGKVLCAFLPLYQQNEYVERSAFEQRTPHSVMDKKLFLEQLKTIQEQKFALDIEEYSEGIGCLAVPVFNYQGSCIATIGVTGSVANYLDEENRQKMLDSLWKSSREISYRFGYREN